MTAAWISAALVLTACSGTPAEPAEPAQSGATGEFQEGGTVSIGIPTDPGNLDPIISAEASGTTVRTSFCEKLYEVYTDGAVFPQLAAGEPEVSEDRLRVTIPIREDAVFADGSPLNAEAVRFGLDRNLNNPASVLVENLDALESVEAVDEFTVALNLNKPMSASALDQMLVGNGTLIVSKEAVETLGDEGFNAAPVCVGAFKFESRIAQDSITLVRDELYYDAENVHLDEVVYRPIPDGSVRATNLRSGDLQVIEGLVPIDVAAVEGDPNLAVINEPSTGYHGIFINHANVGGEVGEVSSPFSDDARVRMALAMSLDREGINQTVFNGAFDVACGFVPPSHPLVTEAMQRCVEYDPEGARALLDETGYDLPIRAEIITDPRPEFRRAAEVIQAMAAEVGFEFEIDVVEASTSSERRDNGDFEIASQGQSGRVDPTEVIGRQVYSGGANWIKYIDPELEVMFDTARTAVDNETLVEAWEGISEHLYNEQPLIFTIRPSLLVGHDASLGGITLVSQGGVSVKNAGYLVE